MISRNYFVPTFLVLACGAPYTRAADDAHLSFWKFLQGDWSYEISPIGVNGITTWTLAANGRALTGRFVDSDGTVSTEVAGWQGDQQVMVANGYGSRGNYWHIQFVKVTSSLIEGPCHGMLPDGRGYKGIFTGNRVNEDHYQFAIDAKTKDGKELNLEGNFTRRENVQAKNDLQAIQGRWYLPSSMKEIQGNVSTLYRYNEKGEVFHSHRTFFCLSQHNEVKVYTGLRSEVLVGKDKGKKSENPFSFIYRVNDKEWAETWGFLPGDQGTPRTFSWTRRKPETKAAVAPEEAKATTKIERSGPDVERLKALTHSWATGDFKTYRDNFSNDATFVHNAWVNKTAKPVAELVKSHQEFHTQIVGKPKILNEYYQVLTFSDGTKWGQCLVENEVTFKTGKQVTTTVFVALLFDKESKVAFEWALFDTGKLPEGTPYKKVLKK